MQIIHPANRFCLPLVDLRSLSQLEREVQARRLAAQDAGRPCDLTTGPLLRICLLLLAKEEYVLLVTAHHIITDGWSHGVLVRELTALYEALAAGQPSPLAPLPIQYADFALWQRQWLQGPPLQKRLDYWKRMLKGATPVNLPTDYPRPEVQSYRGASYTFVLPSDLSEQLKALSRKEGVTLFMTLLATFQTLLYRYTGQTDVVVGTDIANRMNVETEALIGFFVNLLALRSDLSGAPIFRNLLYRVREVILGAYIHQDIPFEMLVEQLRLERKKNQTPLIQVLFVLQNMPTFSQRLPGVVFEAVQNEVKTAKFDLALFIHEAPDGIGGAVVYSTDLFEERTIATLMNRFEVLLHNVVDRPDTSIDALDIYTDAEKAEQAKYEEELYVVGSRDLRASKGEEINLSQLELQHMKQRKH